MCPCVFIYLILVQNKLLKNTQQVRLFIISILFVSLSVFAAPKKLGFIDAHPLQTRSVVLSTQDSLRQAFGIPINDSLLGLDFLKRRKYLEAITETGLAAMTPDNLSRFKELLENITLFAKQNDDDDLALEIAFLRIRLNVDGLAPKVKEQRLLSLDSISNVLKLDWLSARVKYHLGIDYTRTPNRISEGFIYLFKALYILENTISEPNLVSEAYSYVGLTAYRYEQYQLSKRYFKKAVDIKKYRSIRGTNNLALAYKGLKMLDSANYYFSLAKQYAIAENNSVWITIINGNIGENLFLEGEFEAALPLLHADADYCLAIKSYGNASNALVYLSGCYLALGDLVKSERYLWEAYRAAKTDKELRRMKPIYRQLANWSAYNGDAASAVVYRDSLEFVTNQLQLNFNRFSGFEADKLVNLNANQIALSQREKAQEQSEKVLLIIIGASLFGFIILTLLFLNYRANKKLKEKNLAFSNLQLTGKLEDANSQLKVYITETQQKALTEKVILTDANWREFLQHFNKVHPSFVMYLKQQYPKLTKAEVRFCCLSSLSMSDKEMAAMLGVGSASIRVTRQRTRAKLNLKEGDCLETLLLTL
jgi:hypothetical protein